MGYSGPLLPGEKDPSHSHMYLLYSVQMQLRPQYHLHAVVLYLQLVSSLISVVFAVYINNGKHNNQERQHAALDQH
jgi:Tfp pilus assembly protein PilN